MVIYLQISIIAKFYLPRMLLTSTMTYHYNCYMTKQRSNYNSTGTACFLKNHKTITTNEPQDVILRLVCCVSICYG